MVCATVVVMPLRYAFSTLKRLLDGKTKRTQIQTQVLDLSDFIQMMTNEEESLKTHEQQQLTLKISDFNISKL